MRGLRWIATLLVPPPAVLYGPPSYSQALLHYTEAEAAASSPRTRMSDDDYELGNVALHNNTCSFLFCFFFLLFLFLFFSNYARIIFTTKKDQPPPKTMLRSSPTSHGIKERRSGGGGWGGGGGGIIIIAATVTERDCDKNENKDSSCRTFPTLESERCAAGRQ